MESQQIAARDSTNQLSCCAITTEERGARRQGVRVFVTPRSLKTTPKVAPLKTRCFNTTNSIFGLSTLRDVLLQQTQTRQKTTWAGRPQLLAFIFVFVLFCLARCADTAPAKSRRAHPTDLSISSELDTTANFTVTKSDHSASLELAAKRPKPAVFDALAIAAEDKPTTKTRRSSGKKSRSRKQKGGRKGGKRNKGRKGGKSRKNRNNGEILNKQTEKDILNNKSNHKSKVLQETNSPRRQRLYQKEGISFHLAVMPNGKVKGERSIKQSNYSEYCTSFLKPPCARQ